MGDEVHRAGAPLLNVFGQLSASVAAVYLGFIVVRVIG